MKTYTKILFSAVLIMCFSMAVLAQKDGDKKPPPPKPKDPPVIVVEPKDKKPKDDKPKDDKKKPDAFVLYFKDE